MLASYCEWKQNKTLCTYDEEYVHDFISRKMSAALNEMAKIAYSNKVSLREAAYVAALTNLERRYKIHA